MAFNIRNMVADVAKTAPNMNEAQSGGGGYTPPEAGFVRLRFVGYYELGQHEEKFGVAKGKIKNKVRLVFELSGPKHAPREVDGQKVPQRMSVDLTMSLNEKAGFFKLFKAMNHSGKHTHMAEMLGEEFVGTVVHKEKGEGQSKKVYANLKDVRAPFIDSLNEETGEVTKKRIAVDPALSEIKGFLWDHATPEMWDSIFIEGEWEEKRNDKGEVTHPARSKNTLQLLIMSAVNFKGSPIYDYATGKVKKEDAAAMAAELAKIGEGAAAEDALAEIA